MTKRYNRKKVNLITYLAIDKSNQKSKKIFLINLNSNKMKKKITTMGNHLKKNKTSRKSIVKKREFHKVAKKMTRSIK